MTALTEAEAVIAARIAATVEPEPGLAEAWFVDGLVLGTAAGAYWLACARYWWRL